MKHVQRKHLDNLTVSNYRCVFLKYMALPLLGSRLYFHILSFDVLYLCASSDVNLIELSYGPALFETLNLKCTAPYLWEVAYLSSGSSDMKIRVVLMTLWTILKILSGSCSHWSVSLSHQYFGQLTLCFSNMRKLNLHGFCRRWQIYRK